MLVKTLEMYNQKSKDPRDVSFCKVRSPPENKSLEDTKGDVLQ